jgi:hypothetical protein
MLTETIPQRQLYTPYNVGAHLSSEIPLRMLNYLARHPDATYCHQVLSCRTRLELCSIGAIQHSVLRSPSRSNRPCRHADRERARSIYPVGRNQTKSVSPLHFISSSIELLCRLFSLAITKQELINASDVITIPHPIHHFLSINTCVDFPRP